MALPKLLQFIFRDIDICTKFHGNPPNTWDTSLKTINSNLMVALKEKLGDLLSH